MDAAGRFAIPGLFDMHQHSSWMIGDTHGDSWDRDRGFDPLQVFIAYGLTSAREVGGQFAFVNALVDRTQTTSDPLPRWFPSGSIFEGQASFGGSLRIRNEVEARDYVRLWKEWGAHFIKVYPSLSWPLQRAVIEEARLQGPTRGRARQQRGGRNGQERDPGLYQRRTCLTASPVRRSAPITRSLGDSLGPDADDENRPVGRRTRTLKRSEASQFLPSSSWPG